MRRLKRWLLDLRLRRVSDSTFSDEDVLFGSSYSGVIHPNRLKIGRRDDGVVFGVFGSDYGCTIGVSIPKPSDMVKSAS